MPLTARTRTLLTWLPATVLVLIIAGVVVASLAIQGSWWTEDRPVASDDQRASDGSSMLTDTGFDYVNVAGTFKVRVGEGGLSASELGLASDGEKSAEFRRPVRAVIAAGEELYVLDDILGLTAVGEDDVLASVTFVPDVAGNWIGAIDYLRSLAPDLGWDAAQLDPLTAELGEFNRTGTEDTFTAQIGPSEGPAKITGNIAFDRASGGTFVTITFEPGS
ncbi:hypothetical protein IF188_13945 [Microbacterium sp. NEAU-LLC]|uniref:Uncharacterized protein n=1 Tax=Microbacterium helvum TaxID=2773713 RepID=A0ABR8NQ77_9MICO|nr:hypothetical protein [Microbacterium helvum]MBD3942799.1 hypothetical protein [Microbacterium helvum]